MIKKNSRLSPPPAEKDGCSFFFILSSQFFHIPSSLEIYIKKILNDF